MNAGCYGREIKDIFVEAAAIDGARQQASRCRAADMGFAYRKSRGAATISIFVEARVRRHQRTNPPPSARAWTRWSASAKPASRSSRRTGGSTFKNPPGHKAWQLIDEAGCRGLDASARPRSREKHCNFLINTGDATAADIEALGEEVRARVKAKSGIELEWEIKRRGRAHDALPQDRGSAGRAFRRTRGQPVSGRGCAKALREEGFDVVEIDPRRRSWPASCYAAKPDAVFNALHGRWGEDGCVQGLLELMRIPYTHSGVLASALAMHKERTKDVYRAAGLPVVKSIVADRREAAAAHLMEPPYVVKPVNEGSSVGVFIIRKGDNRPPAELGSDNWTLSDEMMVEEFVPGRELTVAVMGDKALWRVTEITTESRLL